MLAGGARGQPDAPREPFGAGAEAVAPAAARVELSDQVEQVCGGGIKVRGQLGDLITETLERRDARGVGTKLGP